MDIHILLDAPDETTGFITFDTTPINAKAIALIPLLEKLQGFIDSHQTKVDKALMQRHPYFKKFSPDKQMQILKEFRQSFTLWDLDNPLPETKAPIIIIT